MSFTSNFRGAFRILLSIYKKLKIQLNINTIFTFLLMSAPFSYLFGPAALLSTVVVCGCTLFYLVIEQQQIIKPMQKSLYSICLKSIVGQVSESDNGNDSGVDSNKLSSVRFLFSLTSLQGDRLIAKHLFSWKRNCTSTLLVLPIFLV